jgi:mannose-6-phosphate isomerase-like protein (cupin superfamily)
MVEKFKDLFLWEKNMITVALIAQMWLPYFEAVSWQELVKNIRPKMTGCGLIYELDNPFDQTSNTFAIADMRDISLATPHYHTNGETEIYIVLQGSGITVVGHTEHELTKGTIVITPPEVAHFTIPKKDLVLAVLNIPDFNPENCVFLSESNPAMHFDKDQLERLKNITNPKQTISKHYENNFL